MEGMEKGFSYSLLTPTETQIVIKCRELHQQKAALQTVIQYLMSLDDITKLIRLAELVPRIETWCLDRQFADYWQQVWAYSSRFPTWPEAQQGFLIDYRPLKPQPGLNSFDLVRGMYFYNLANNLLGDDCNLTDPQVQFYLQKSLKYHCYEGLSLFCEYQLQQVEADAIGWQEAYDATITVLNQSLVYHGTPVFLLLAYCELQFTELLIKEKDEHYFLIRHHHLTKALSYVKAAQEVGVESEIAIFNAYYGQGLSASNNNNWTNFTEWANGIIESIDVPLRDYIMQAAADSGAKQAVYFRSEHTHLFSPNNPDHSSNQLQS